MTRLASAESEAKATTAEATAGRGRGPDSELAGEPSADRESERSATLDAADAADRIRERGERVRRRELDTALRRLREQGEVSPAERRILAVLAERLTDALVEQWASKLADDEASPEAALALLTE